MSVILDALHKARGDKRNRQTETQPNSVARVVDTGTAHGAAVEANAETQARNHSGGRGWVIALSVIFGMVCLFTLIGGAFFFLYDQVKRLEERGAATTVAAAPVSSSNSAGMNAPVGNGVAVAGINPTSPSPYAAGAQPAALPTPLPLTELPVSPPATAPRLDTASAASAPATTGTAAAPATPVFELGSIVCQNDECIASLNDRSVSVGDESQGYRVIKITPSEVTLKHTTSNDVKTLSLY